MDKSRIVSRNLILNTLIEKWITLRKFLKLPQIYYSKLKQNYYRYENKQT